jgi:hypothetical protein
VAQVLFNSSPFVRVARTQHHWVAEHLEGDRATQILWLGIRRPTPLGVRLIGGVDFIAPPRHRGYLRGKVLTGTLFLTHSVNPGQMNYEFGLFIKKSINFYVFQK